MQILAGRISAFKMAKASIPQPTLNINSVTALQPECTDLGLEVSWELLPSRSWIPQQASALLYRYSDIVIALSISQYQPQECESPCYAFLQNSWYISSQFPGTGMCCVRTPLRPSRWCFFTSNSSCFDHSSIIAASEMHGLLGRHPPDQASGRSARGSATRGGIHCQPHTSAAGGKPPGPGHGRDLRCRAHD